MIGSPSEGITLPNGCRGDIVLVTGRDWGAFTTRLQNEESVSRSQLMPGEREALGELRRGTRLSWPLKRCRKLSNIFLYIGDDDSLLDRPWNWR